MSQSYSIIEKNTLIFKKQNTKNELKINFHQTLRVPDNNTLNALPANLGNFPLYHVEDYNLVPEHWKSHGGIFLPMHQSEAMWISFNSTVPYAIKIATGKINAITGEEWTPSLKNKPLEYTSNDYVTDYLYRHFNLKKTIKNHHQDYFVIPDQPWIDGFNVGEGIVRQFIASPLGQGITVEEQLSTEESLVGGIQIIAYPMKVEMWNILQEKRREEMKNRIFRTCASGINPSISLTNSSSEMGLAAGGLINQQIYEDQYGLEFWDTENPVKVFVHILNSEQFEYVTKQKPPMKPLTEEDYKMFNFPWYHHYKDQETLAGSVKLSKIKSANNLKVIKNLNW